MATAEQIGQIRLLIADLDEANEVFTDAQLGEMFGMEGDSVRRAAAMALETQAADLTAKAGAVRGLLDVQLDASGSATALLGMARRLRRGAGQHRATWLSQFTVDEDVTI